MVGRLLQNFWIFKRNIEMCSSTFFAKAAPCRSLLFHKFLTFCYFLNVSITLETVLSVLYQCTTVFVCYVWFEGRQLSLLLGVPCCRHGIAACSEQSLGFF